MLASTSRHLLQRLQQQALQGLAPAAAAGAAYAGAHAARLASSSAAESSKDGGSEASEQPPSSSEPSLVTLGARQTSTGYPETFLGARAAHGSMHDDPSGFVGPSTSGQPQLPQPVHQEVLKVRLRQQVEQGDAQAVQVDVFELSR